MKWQVLNKSKDVIKALLENRGLKTKKEQDEFFNPKDPKEIGLKDLGVKKEAIKKALKRIKEARDKKEDVIIYGDYDADGICATAILWEALHKYGLDVLPHIPDRFSEGYGLNASSVEKLKAKSKKLKLIITVDNGIVAFDGIKKAKELGIDVIVLDHHTKGKVRPKAYCLIYSTAVCGSGLAYFFSKELSLDSSSSLAGLELAAIGTIADQMPLIGINRSIVKYGLVQLKNTNRKGLMALFSDSKIENVGTYEVNYIIAPRINAMGRLAQGLDSLRLLCTTKDDKAQELSKLLTKTNSDRQNMVDRVMAATLGEMKDKSKEPTNKVLVLAHESYHEGVIGLAAGKLVEEFYRPSIVISKGKEKSKASARSISGFNIIEAIKSTGLILEGGGHPMAAGFSIETTKIEEFTQKINELSNNLLDNELLTKKLKVDMELGFSDLSYELLNKLKGFEPIGLGNPGPTFVTKNVEIKDIKAVGKEAKHLKITLKQGEYFFDSIYFGGGEMCSDLKPGSKIDVVYQLEDNTWNGSQSLQLKIKDLKVN